MRNRTQRIEDRAGLDEHELGKAAVEICRTIDDIGDEVETKLDHLITAVDTLIATISAAARRHA